MIDLNKSIQEKQDKLNRDIEELKKDLEKVKFIVMDGWAYETKDHDFDKTYNEILNSIPKNKQLWDKDDCIKLYEDNRFNLKYCWFWIERIFKDKSARFGASSVGANFCCGRNPTSSYASLGVRYKWRMESKNQIISDLRRGCGKDYDRDYSTEECGVMICGNRGLCSICQAKLDQTLLCEKEANEWASVKELSKDLKKTLGVI